MKKKGLLITIVSLALVAVLAVGGTIAALTAEDEKVVNNFTFAAGLTVTLTEAEPTKVADETITGNATKGYNYTNVVPGQTLNKEPKISATTTVPAYVFVKVSGFSEANNISCTTFNTTAWTAMPTVDANGNGVYYKAISADLTATPIFTGVTVRNFEISEGGTATIGSVKIEVSMIQSAGFATVADALAAAPAFES